MSIILACDISTTISGYTVLSEGCLVENESVDTRNGYDSIYGRLQANRELLRRFNGEYNINEVFIEEPVKSFSSGFSKASTISKLAKFNGMVSLVVYDEIGIEPEYLKASSARKKAGLTVSQKSDKSYKQQAFEYIDETEEQFEYELTYADNPKPEAYDRSDSLIIARAAENIIDEKETEKES